MIGARFVSLFRHILPPGFDFYLVSVLTSLTKPEKWEGLYGIGGLQHQFSDHATLVNIQLTETSIHLNELEAR